MYLSMTKLDLIHEPIQFRIIIGNYIIGFIEEGWIYDFCLTACCNCDITLRDG